MRVIKYGEKALHYTTCSECLSELEYYTAEVYRETVGLNNDGMSYTETIKCPACSSTVIIKEEFVPYKRFMKDFNQFYENVESI